MKKIVCLSLLLSCGGVYAREKAALIPIPRQIEWKNASFTHREARLEAPDSLLAQIRPQLDKLGIRENPKSSHTIRVVMCDTLAGVTQNFHEAYTLDVSRNKIEIQSGGRHGLFNAMQTLGQLTVNNRITGCSITDWPAFSIRGFMQDVGRTYISMEELKREIAMLSRYKINVFHWHLTENQAWRLESKIFPMLNDSVNMTRMAGSYYTLDEARELVRFCKEHQVLLIPEIDMPGHSAAFERVFRHDMQSPEGMKILKLLIDEVCETFEVPFLHIGTDEVKFTNPHFVDEMVAYIRAKGKKVISWNPGWNYKEGEVDMTQLWSSRGKPTPGIPCIDSRLHYLNHFDTFGDIIALYNSNIYYEKAETPQVAGVIMALWHDRMVLPEEQIILQNNFYPNMLAIAERAWQGDGTEYFDGNGTNLQAPGTEAYIRFQDFEKRMLTHKERYFEGYPFGYVRQTQVEWRITEPFPNDGDLLSCFPPEEKLDTAYVWNGTRFATRKAYGAGIYLRHVWGTLIPGFYADPKENHTAYAYTYVYAPASCEVGLQVEFQNYGRSEMDLAPLPGKWDYRESRIWVNDQEIHPPVWSATHRERSNEIPLGNENFLARKPLPVTLHKGWNKVFLKLPVGKFSTPEVRLQKWMFSTIFVTPDGKNAVEGLIYNSDHN